METVATSSRRQPSCRAHLQRLEVPQHPDCRGDVAHHRRTHLNCRHAATERRELPVEEHHKEAPVKWREVPTVVPVNPHQGCRAEDTRPLLGAYDVKV